MGKYKGKNDYMKIINELLNVHDVKERADTVNICEDCVFIYDKNHVCIIDYTFLKMISLPSEIDYIVYKIIHKDNEKYILEQIDTGFYI